MCMSEWNGDIKKTNQQTYSQPFTIWREEKRPNVQKFERKIKTEMQIEGE